MERHQQTGIRRRKRVEETNKHFGLALTSLILGGVSLLSFMLYGLSAIPGIDRSHLWSDLPHQRPENMCGSWAGSGMAVCILGIIAAVAMVYLYASMINWQNVNMDAFLRVCKTLIRLTRPR